MAPIRFARRAVLLAGLSSLLVGCGFITGLFPDKQKQYRYSSDIPPLEIPPDLTASTIEGREENERGSRTARGAAREESVPEVEAPEERRKSSVPADERSAQSGSAPKSNLAQSQSDVPLIEVEAPFAETWNDVSRALGRLEIELTDQNRSDGVFYVYYGGESPRPKPGETSLWQDFKSLFGGAGDRASEFRIKLEEAGDYTNVFVLDSSGKAVTEGLGFELLKRLNDTLSRLDQPEAQDEREKK